MGARQVFVKIAGGFVILVVLAIGGLVAWNMFGQGPYADTRSAAARFTA